MADLERQVAGRVALVTHLGEVKAGWLSRGQSRLDHEVLERYGYDMSLCDCLPQPEPEFRLWQATSVVSPT